MDLATLTLREYTADFNFESETGSARRTTLRRCRTREQGCALMTVGHAIEYLMDSRLVHQQTLSEAEQEALAILLRANLSVYNEGAEIVPLASRLRRWFHGGAKAEAANAAG